MKPPTSPSKGKSVGNFLSMGLELLKGKLSICLGWSNEYETVCGTKEVAAIEEKHGNEIEFCSLFSSKVTRSMGSMERQHSLAVSSSLDCLQSAVCRVPLIEGAMVSPLANQKKLLRLFMI
ncbi:hypothetical protein H5410_021455 [Solanum commersonii]|uniref:Uncharacterized protein n=1 Tax=Solanum commersonii TaxID=4109 RepID=A0A9J5ZH92_SOLCO|nr:hypothetical protein H5410_021455 [Solanum commersonii]